MSQRLTTVTGYGTKTISQCGELNPESPTHFCTRDNPDHQGDHHHEYSDTTWPRESRRR
jgi:hypothetical protein